MHKYTHTHTSVYLRVFAYMCVRVCECVFFFLAVLLLLRQPLHPSGLTDLLFRICHMFYISFFNSSSHDPTITYLLPFQHSPLFSRLFFPSLPSPHQPPPPPTPNPPLSPLSILPPFLLFFPAQQIRIRSRHCDVMSRHPAM